MMRNIFLILVFISSLAFARPVEQNIFVKVHFDNKSIEVYDTIYAEPDSNGAVYFELGKNFEALSANNSDVLIFLDSTATYNRFKIFSRDTAKGNGPFIIKYSGVIKGKLIESPEYGRSFSETDGIISKNGVYLAGASGWVPVFGDALFTFNLYVEIDKDWNIVSQGKRTGNEVMGEKRMVTYQCPYPMEEVYLIGGKWTEYQKQFGNVLVEAYLQTPDEDLANKYIEATNGYLKLYEKMLGDFPFERFALVENFWETGYGMPSFTLLGQKVIRFPWILYSSYPHELLHNYWGNSVYVDYSKGNWCEGITAYMADHLFKEQSGMGATYRRNALQKYLDYAAEGNDFPISEFISRHSASEEAVGYGKTLMVFHMLRMKYGDEKFLEAWRYLYDHYKFKKASFDDIRLSFETVTGDSLRDYFDQWINRKGAPAIKLSNVIVGQEEGRLKLNFTLEQKQVEEVFDLDVPVAVFYENETRPEITWVSMNQRKQEFIFSGDPGKRPLAIQVDPEFDIFRLLDRSEVPVTISTLLGKNDHLIIYPRLSPLYNEYFEFAQSFQKFLKDQNKSAKLLADGTVTSIPDNKVVWILGKENRYALLNKNLEKLNATLSPEKKELVSKTDESGTAVFTFANPDDNSQSFGYIVTSDMYALPNLIRKMPHYGKYSYIGFKDRILQNTLKGVYPVLDSPMIYTLKYKSGAPEVNIKYPPRKALAE